MRFSTLNLLALLGATIAQAATTQSNGFYLVTTSQSEPASNSSELASVNATSPWVHLTRSPYSRLVPANISQFEEPVSNAYFLLRLIGPGYNSLPNVTLASGSLSMTIDSHRGPKTKYSSGYIAEDQELKFLSGVEEGGNIDLDGGYLVTVNGEKEGWKICGGDNREKVLYWKGTNSTCRETYLQAVRLPPY